MPGGGLGAGGGVHCLAGRITALRRPVALEEADVGRKAAARARPRSPTMRAAPRRAVAELGRGDLEHAVPAAAKIAQHLLRVGAEAARQEVERDLDLVIWRR